MQEFVFFAKKTDKYLKIFKTVVFLVVFSGNDDNCVKSVLVVYVLNITCDDTG